MEIQYLLYGSYGILPEMLRAKKTRNFSVGRFLEPLARKVMIMAVMCAWLDGSANSTVLYTTLSQHTMYKHCLKHDFFLHVSLSSMSLLLYPKSYHV